MLVNSEYPEQKNEQKTNKKKNMKLQCQNFISIEKVKLENLFLNKRKREMVLSKHRQSRVMHFVNKLLIKMCVSRVMMCFFGWFFCSFTIIMWDITFIFTYHEEWRYTRLPRCEVLVQPSHSFSFMQFSSVWIENKRNFFLLSNFNGFVNTSGMKAVKRRIIESCERWEICCSHSSPTRLFHFVFNFFLRFHCIYLWLCVDLWTRIQNAIAFLFATVRSASDKQIGAARSVSKKKKGGYKKARKMKLKLLNKQRMKIDLLNYIRLCTFRNNNNNKTVFCSSKLWKAATKKYIAIMKTYSEVSKIHKFCLALRKVRQLASKKNFKFKLCVFLLKSEKVWL